jgi:hypothetical protein
MVDLSAELLVGSKGFQWAALMAVQRVFQKVASSDAMSVAMLAGHWDFRLVERKVDMLVAHLVETTAVHLAETRAVMLVETKAVQLVEH